ncbi:MAG: CinA family protein [Janthinobacterium lividum]
MFDAEMLEHARLVVEANRAAGLRIVTAESCTGGLVAGVLTEIPGSSDVVDRGFVTYSNEAKLESLGVNLDILETFGAVSVAVAWAMAKGALVHSHADVAVAVTGIAGPGGGSERKPVGMVVFAVAHRNDPPGEPVADTKFFGDLGRSEVRRQAVLCALELLMPVAAGAP